MIRSLLIQMAQELEFQLDASKGGNVRGITEDHRYEMAKSLHTLRSVLRDLEAEGRVMIVTGTTEQIRHILCGAQQHNEHCKGWRWELYVRDQRNSRAERDAMLMAEVRKIGAERRERLAALRGEVQALEAAE